MATSFLKKTMVYLGLVDDEYDDHDEYEERAPRGFSAVSSRVEPRSADDLPEERAPSPAPVRRIRTMPVDSPAGAQRAEPSVVTPRSSSVRPLSADSAKVEVVAPSRFGDAKDIADCLKSNRPVIVNLQVAERDLQRRMIDFCSGVTYALSGEMEKVADQVFLLAPTNVKLSEEERQRLQARGFGRS
jgi:cell division inhibitor SepF